MTQTTQRSLLNQPGNSTQTTVTAGSAPEQGQVGDAPSEQPVHDWEKRYKDLQSFNSRKINELTNEVKALKEQGVPKVQAPRTPEEMETFKSANPEMYSVIQHMATEISQAQMQGYDQKMATVQNDLLDTKQDKMMLTIREAHPDFEQIVNSDGFSEWTSAQSSTVKDWIWNNPDNPELAIKALSLYKYESGQKQTKAPEAHAAVITNSSGATETDSRNHPAKLWKESEIQQMSPSDFIKWEDTISLAQREGRILIGQ